MGNIVNIKQSGKENPLLTTPYLTPFPPFSFTILVITPLPPTLWSD